MDHLLENVSMMFGQINLNPEFLRQALGASSEGSRFLECVPTAPAPQKP